MFGGGEAINLISLLKETNGILSIIPDLGRIYNLFAPQSIGGKCFEAVAIKYWGYELGFQEFFKKEKKQKKR